jgi:hypothetical protein
MSENSTVLEENTLFIKGILYMLLLTIYVAATHHSPTLRFTFIYDGIITHIFLLKNISHLSATWRQQCACSNGKTQTAFDLS